MKNIFTACIIFFGILSTSIKSQNLDIEFPDSTIIPSHLISEWKLSGAKLSEEYDNAEKLNFIDFVNYYNANQNNEIELSASSLNQLFSALDLSFLTYLKFPEGNYKLRLNEPIQVPSNLIIHGEGSEKTIIYLKEFEVKSDVFSFSGVNNSGIHHLTIDCSNFFEENLKDNVDNEVNLTNKSIVNFINSEHCSAIGVKTNMGFGGHYSINNSDYVTIHGCHLDDAWLHGSNTGGTQGYGVVFGGNVTDNSDHCLIENNIIENCRHAIVVQYYANNNVIAYNYTKDSRAYNYYLSMQLSWPTSDIVLHGNGPEKNLLEGNYNQGLENGLTSSNGITIDNVKTVDNQPLNTLYRNYTPMLMRVQDNGCDYNNQQLLIANKASGYTVNSSAHNLLGNIISGISIPLDLGLDCNGDLNINLQPNSQTNLGNSAYLNENTTWLSSNLLPVYGVNEQGENIPAYNRYSTSTTTTECDYCEEKNTTTSTEKINTGSENPTFTIYPNPTSDFLYVKNPEPDNRDLFVTIFSMEGKEVYTEQIKTTSTALYIHDLKKGSYFVSINNLSGFVYKEIMMKK